MPLIGLLVTPKAKGDAVAGDPCLFRISLYLAMPSSSSGGGMKRESARARAVSSNQSFPSIVASTFLASDAAARVFGDGKLIDDEASPRTQNWAPLKDFPSRRPGGLFDSTFIFKLPGRGSRFSG